MLRKVKTKKNKIFSSKEMSNILAGGCPIACGCNNCGTYIESMASLSSNSSNTYIIVDPPTQ